MRKSFNLTSLCAHAQTCTMRKRRAQREGIMDIIHVVIFAAVALIVGYFFGCVSTGYIVGKVKHRDIRNEGSGNIGTTNALRTLGAQAALITFLGDVLKAMVPILILRLVLKENVQDAYIFGMYLGFGVVLGHNFPFWLGFKGGKGIAVTSAVVLSLADWRVILVGLALFIIIVALTRYVSLGSLVVAWYLPVNTFLFYRDADAFVHMLVVSLCFTLLAYIRHWENIKRLLSGNERKLGEKGTQKEDAEK